MGQQKWQIDVCLWDGQSAKADKTGKVCGSVNFRLLYPPTTDGKLGISILV